MSYSTLHPRIIRAICDCSGFYFDDEVHAKKNGQLFMMFSASSRHPCATFTRRILLDEDELKNIQVFKICGKLYVHIKEFHPKDGTKIREICKYAEDNKLTLHCFIKQHGLSYNDVRNIERILPEGTLFYIKEIGTIYEGKAEHTRRRGKLFSIVETNSYNLCETGIDKFNNLLLLEICDVNDISRCLQILINAKVTPRKILLMSYKDNLLDLIKVMSSK